MKGVEVGRWRGGDDMNTVLMHEILKKIIN